jgi:hypothetical protein
MKIIMRILASITYVVWFNLLPMCNGFVSIIQCNNNNNNINYVNQQQQYQNQQQHQYQWRQYMVTTTTTQQQQQLEPEPEGGKELVPRTSIPGCRMKELEFVRNAANDNEQGPVYKFWMAAQAEGTLIKEIRDTILKDASKKANFPGFRKV